jgi:hypothetical protein
VFFRVKSIGIEYLDESNLILYTALWIHHRFSSLSIYYQNPNITPKTLDGVFLAKNDRHWLSFWDSVSNQAPDGELPMRHIQVYFVQVFTGRCFLGQR